MRIRTHSRIIVNFDSFLYYIYFSELFFNAKENKIFTGFKMASAVWCGYVVTDINTR